MDTCEKTPRYRLFCKFCTSMHDFRRKHRYLTSQNQTQSDQNPSRGLMYTQPHTIPPNFREIGSGRANHGPISFKVDPGGLLIELRKRAFMPSRQAVSEGRTLSKLWCWCHLANPRRLSPLPTWWMDEAEDRDVTSHLTNAFTYLKHSNFALPLHTSVQSL